MMVPAGGAGRRCRGPLRNLSATLSDMGAEHRDIERWFESERARSCGNKRRYESEREALDGAYLIRMQGGESLDAYRCRFCGGWHLGHSRPPGQA